MTKKGTLVNMNRNWYAKVNGVHYYLPGFSASNNLSCRLCKVRILNEEEACFIDLED